MNSLDEIFHLEINKIFSFEKVGTRVVARKLEKQGVILTPEQLEKLEIRLANIKDEAESLILEGILSTPEENTVIDINEGSEFDEILDELSKQIETVTLNVTNSMSQIILRQLHKDAPRMLKEHWENRCSFEQRLIQRWGKAFDLIEMLIVIAFEAGEEFNRELRPEAAKKNDLVFDVLTRLHARSCQIAYEILALLRAGFADGAHARWRSMHEISVVASFIKDHGNIMAERYLSHHQIESYKAAIQQQQYATRLKQTSISKKEVDRLKKIYDKLLARYGKNYRNPYGWAAAALGKDNPNFSDIEEAVQLDHFRPYYKLASHNVHANPKGIVFRMGLKNSKLLLAGASNDGLADPGHGMAISLTQVTTCLLLSQSNIDRLVVCRILLKLTDKIGKELIKAHRAKPTKSFGRSRIR